MTHRIVLSWVEASTADAITDGKLPPGPSTAPAIRVWADVILELIAQKSGLAPEPPLSIRRHALFGWMQRTPLPSSLQETDRVQLQLEVDAMRCAVARREFVDGLLGPPEWRAMRMWLQEQGHSADLIDEEVMTIEAPTWPMHISEGFDAVASTQPQLLDDILRYFEPDAVRYIESWQPLADWSGHPRGSWEVVVPPDAVTGIDIAS
jgi:hypothetical protein